jgi:hypothetical protein
MNNDTLLAMVVEFGSKMEEQTEGKSRVAITLTVGGLLISGEIISARRFFHEHPLTHKIWEEIEARGKSEAEKTDSEDKERPEFIHLSDTHYFTPNQPPIPSAENGIYWRGRISEIAGFSFGVLKVSESQGNIL